jgi:hypothetical protein
MQQYMPLNVLPMDIQQDWMATLQKATPTDKGVFRLVNIRRTQPKSFEEQRVIVLVVDENGFPMPNVRVAFSYSTANQYVLTPDFLWSPPPPARAFIVPTAGSGQIDQIQGSAVKQGEPGGITVYLFEPDYSSDVVTGAGMLADHTGLHLTYQLLRTGVVPIEQRLTSIEARLVALEAKV